MADGFTPLVQPRKTRPTPKPKPKAPVTGPDTIHPEDFIPPRKTKKTAPVEPPKIAAPKKSRAEITDDFLEPTRAFDFDEETGELVTAKPTEDTPKKPAKSAKNSGKKGRKKWSKKRKIWTWVGIIIALLLIGGVIWFIVWGNDLIGRLTGGQGNLVDLFTESYQPLEKDKNGRTNILAYGTSGFDMEGTEFEGAIHDGAELTDSIMVISFNQDTGDAVMISLPRDLKVDNTCTMTGKINEVYWCNNQEDTDEKAGAEALMEVVGDILGIDPQYYVHVNWGSLKEIVDSIGGITVTLDESVADYDYTGAVFDAGVPYNINGDQAVGLARARHGTENGDFSRGAFQQKILIGIKDKVLKDNLSIPEILSLANTLGDNFRTNFSVGELKSLAHLGGTIDWTNITQVSFLEPEPLLTDGMINGISYVFPTAGVGVYTEIRDYIQSILAASAPEDPTILVLNATSRDGVAAAEQASLEADGFTNITVDNIEGDFPAPYTLYTFTDSAPESQATLEEKYGVTTSSTSPADIPTNYDFVIVIGE